MFIHRIEPMSFITSSDRQNQQRENTKKDKNNKEKDKDNKEKEKKNNFKEILDKAMQSQYNNYNNKEKEER